MLDISYLSDDEGVRPSFAIADSELALFERAFGELRNRTGLHIDPYGTCRIYPTHQRTLATLLSGSRQERVVEFVEFLEASTGADEVLIADGE
ncbi:hypothetical protein [Xanthomonas sp. 1678]|uniref:hypothetical protein n=1 Tax=Xanthomonas sp. 1678 TaxID=3158788 RepID=UPI00285C8E91|nr:hypothetical protein [Xanthomonas translucens]